MRIRQWIMKSMLISFATAVILFATFISAPLPLTPNHNDVAKIELWASRNACVGNPAKWSRTYELVAGGRILPDFSRIFFTFEDPTVSNPDGTRRMVGLHVPWRQSMMFGTGWADDRQQRIAYGIFDRKRQVITEWTCGCNTGGRKWQSFPRCDD